MLCPHIRKQAVWTRSTPVLWQYIKLSYSRPKAHPLCPQVPNTLVWTRFSKTIGIFSQKPTLSSTASQKKKTFNFLS